MQDFRRFYINGEWITPDTAREEIAVLNPATEEQVGVIMDATHEDADRAIAAAKAAFSRFSKTSKKERLALLDKIIAVYKSKMEEMAVLIRLEMGGAA